MDGTGKGVEGVLGLKPYFDVRTTVMGAFEPEKLIAWTGRVCRRQYAIVFLLVMIILVNGAASVMVKWEATHGSGVFVWKLILMWLFYLNFCNMAKRLHDVGKTMFHAVAVFFVYVWILVFQLLEVTTANSEFVEAMVVFAEVYIVVINLYCLFAEGVAGVNPYGPDIRELEALALAGAFRDIQEPDGNGSGGIAAAALTEKAVAAKPDRRESIVAEGTAVTDTAAVAETAGTGTVVETDGKRVRQFCSMCGEKVGTDAVFCPYCGERLEGRSGTEAAAGKKD